MKWSKKIHFRVFETWIMPIGNANIHIQINVSEFINKIVSFTFCEFNRVTCWNESKNIILYFVISNSKIEILVSFSRSTNVNVNLSFPNSKFEENLVLMETWKLNVVNRGIYYAKNTNFSYVWRLEFFVKKWNMYEAHILPRPLKQTCRLVTTPLCLSTRLRVNKKFQNSH